MNKVFLVLPICILLFGCIANQLAGRHYIRHPETGERIWAQYHITTENWDSENKVWRNSDGSICEDIYLYPEKED